MRGEPVRGGLPDPGFYSLPGIEQGNALRRGLVPRPPLAHLIGLVVTQVGPGTATLTVPASPWLEFGEGLDVEILAEAALSTAVLTGAPAGSDVRTSAMSFTPFRPATLDAAKFIAHGRVIRSAPTFTYAEAAVEDDLGREVARATAVVAIRPRNPPPPPAQPLGPVFEEPTYPTPDPYLRPLPLGVGPVPRQWFEQQDGLTLLRSLLAGEPVLPIFALFDARVIEANRGRVTMGLVASEWFCHRGREVTPGVLARVVTQVLTGAQHSIALVGARLGIVNVSVTFLRPLLPDGREIVAEAQVTEHYGDSVVASALVTDADGERVVTGYQTSVFLPLRPRPSARAESVLATVLFTDLVGSTARASQLGDEQWRQLLREHETGARRQLQAFAGREIKTTGDGFLATFDSPARAARCARAIREDTRRLGIEVRAGIHTGECEFAGGDVAGIAVHIASRVLAAAAPGEVLVSSTVRDLLLGSGLRFEDRGRHELKGIEGEWQLFALEE